MSASFRAVGWRNTTPTGGAEWPQARRRGHRLAWGILGLSIILSVLILRG